MLSTQDFQKTLLSNGGEILDNINPGQVEKYSYIKETLFEENVSVNQEFQEEFIALHEFRTKRIKLNIRKKFFELLERQKNKHNFNIRKLSKNLFDVHHTNYRPKHFSLLTRLMHTIHENYPVYDKNVAELFEYTPPKGTKVSNLRKLNEYASFYSHMIGVYREVLSKGKLYDLLRVVELKFKSHKDALNQSKNLDLLVRSAGDLKRRGLLLVPLSRFA